MQSVTTILEDIVGERIAAADAVGRSLDAIARLDAGIGAFATLADREAAMSNARSAAGPLAGIAVGIKDNFDTADLETTYGSPAYAGYRPPVDSALVAMIRAAGATVVGKTVSTEFAYLSPAATRNPRNRAHTPGGSSSGSAAAVAAGMVPVATGTQTGGSVIRPAAYCGIAGFKPSFRLLPTVGVKTFSWSLDTCGVFAASAADISTFLAHATRRNLTTEPVDPRRLRIAIYRPRNGADAEAEIWAAVETIANRAREAGATLSEIDEPDALAAARDVHGTIQDYEAGLAMADDLLRHRAAMSDVLRNTLDAGRQITPERYDEARSVARRARKAATAMFESADVLLLPSATGAAPEGLGSTGSPAFNKLWTLTGNPCLNVPGMADRRGLPLGIQVVARFGQDRQALSVGRWLETLV